MIVLVAPRGGRGAGGARQSMVGGAHLRLMVLLLLFAAGILAILGRLALLAISTAPASATATTGSMLPVRGDIVDRNGAPLARTIDGWSIYVRPSRMVGKKSELAAQLARLMPEVSEARYYAILNSGRGAYLRRRATPKLVTAVNALGEPAIEFPREPERLYPQAQLAAHVLGFLDAEGTGAAGMEKVLDGELRSAAGREHATRLSIDLRVQAALENELSRAMSDLQAVGAAGLILDVDTGEILAMVSLPSFNPNALTGAAPANNVTQSRYELGSAFKPIAVAAALDAGTTSITRRYDATEPVKIGRFTINDDHPERRWLSIPELLIHSSNIATAKLADEMGREPLEAIFRKLGFDKPAPVEIEKWSPLWPSDWSRSTTLTTAYGHGISVTPLHLASAYAALVNGGTYRPPTLRKVAPGKAPTGTRVISEETSAQIRQLLRLIVTDGTGKHADAPGYRVGGKTGTAERPAVGGYSRSKNVSTFAAAFPMDAPRYVVLAMLDSPVANARSSFQRTAGWTAAPVVSRVVLRAGPFLGVIPDTARDIDTSRLRSLIWHRKEEVAGQ